ncbi:MAG: hypothetical protein EU539_13165, partial [Promethearchaeota archaeon]
MGENNKLKEKLEGLRKEINHVDDELIQLLEKRAEIVLKIGDIKKTLNLDIFQPLREKEIIERLKSKVHLLNTSSLEAIWKEIMGACKELQGSPIRVGYLGPQGTFTHKAAMNFFSKTGTLFIDSKSIIEIFANIEKNTLDFGVIPIENSLQG